MVVTSSVTNFCRIFILFVGGRKGGGLEGQKVGEHKTVKFKAMF